MRMPFLLVTLLSVGLLIGCSGNGGGSGTSPAMSLAQKIFDATGMTYSDVLSQVAQQYADEWKNDPTLSPTVHDSATIISDVKTIDTDYAATIVTAAEENYVDTAENAGNANLAWENHFKDVDYSGYDDYGCGFAYTDYDFGGGMKRYYFWVVILADKS